MEKPFTVRLYFPDRGAPLATYTIRATSLAEALALSARDVNRWPEAAEFRGATLRISVEDAELNSMSADLTLK